MLVFITSIRHPWNCNSYARVGKLARLSIESVCNQTDSGFEVVVVCNRIPPGTFPKNIHFVEVSFPPPSPVKTPTTGLEAIWLDRGSKYVVGIAYARRFAPEHIMFFDGDDLVSNRLSEFVNQTDGPSGWVMYRGYMLRYGDDHVVPIEDFFRLCGTSVIHPADALELPEGIEPESDLGQIVNLVDDYMLKSVFGGHRLAAFHYTKVRQTPLLPLPFPGAIWVLGTGENHSGRQGPAAGEVPVSLELAHEFSIPRDWPSLEIEI